MMSNLLYYTADFVYNTILLRMDGTGYSVEQADAGKKEIEVSTRLFPFIRRRFIISIIKANDSICSISVIQKESNLNKIRREKELTELLLVLF